MTLTRRSNFQIALSIVLLGLFACQDPTTLGTDLLSEDQAKVGFSDSLVLAASTITNDTVRTYADNPANQLRSYMFGDFVDPILGKAESSIYAQLRPEYFKANFSNSELDSVVLVLPYDTAGAYGDLAATFGMEVYPMTEQMDRTATYFSSASFMTDPMSIGSGDFVPNLDSINVIDYLTSSQLDTVSYPHLRIHLNEAFGNALLQLDTNQLASDSTFLDELPGIYMKPTRPTPGILSFALNETSYLGGVYVYFTQNDTLKRQFQFGIDQLSARVPSYTMDYTGSAVAPIIGDETKGDSLMVVQGLNGLNARLEIGDIESLQGLIINKAVMEVKLRDFPGNDTTLYEPATSLLLSYETASGDLELISDVLLGINLNQLDQVFGGSFDRETGTYTMSLTSHLQDVIDGELPPVLVISVLGKTENANRSILYGPGHPEFGVKLQVAYTEL